MDFYLGAREAPPKFWPFFALFAREPPPEMLFLVFGNNLGDFYLGEGGYPQLKVPPI